MEFALNAGILVRLFKAFLSLSQWSYFLTIQSHCYCLEVMDRFGGRVWFEVEELQISEGFSTPIRFEVPIDFVTRLADQKLTGLEQDVAVHVNPIAQRVYLDYCLGVDCCSEYEVCLPQLLHLDVHADHLTQVLTILDIIKQSLYETRSVLIDRSGTYAFEGAWLAASIDQSCKLDGEFCLSHPKLFYALFSRFKLAQAEINQDRIRVMFKLGGRTDKVTVRACYTGCEADPNYLKLKQLCTQVAENGKSLDVTERKVSSVLDMIHANSLEGSDLITFTKTTKLFTKDFRSLFQDLSLLQEVRLLGDKLLVRKQRDYLITLHHVLQEGSV
ncbi:hypothetical protein [Chroococcidiopsis sp.]|uniref:hypothetical protein n=1 Tax=Chroococcidiopsis sp. TaxID=3088168 RepID=UPI003F3B3555